MATKVTRAKSILDSLADPATTDNAMALRVATAFAYTYRRDEALTNEQRAGVVLTKIRELIKQIVRDSEVSQAMEAERVRVAPGAEISIGSDE